MSVGQPTVRLNRVSKSFGGFAAVSDLSLSAWAGRIYGLLGPNGAGKTTTIRMMVNITAPDSGSVELFGQRISSEAQDRIGYLPEERGLYKKMKVGEQLKFFAELKSSAGKTVDQKIDYWLHRLGLREWKNRKTMELSKGMQQKVQFITAVLHQPDLLILDEPFSGLDPINLELLKEIVLEHKAAGRTIIFSTHQMDLAERICDDICLLNRSRKILEGSLREIKASFGKNAVALRVDSDNGLLNDPLLVAKVAKHSDEKEVVLAEGVSPQELLRKLVDSGATITKFELIEPSLNDIFIAKVSEG